MAAPAISLTSSCSVLDGSYQHMHLLWTEMQAYADNALLAGSFRVGSIIGPIGEASGKAERAGPIIKPESPPKEPKCEP
jgi:hypothetical protein